MEMEEGLARVVQNPTFQPFTPNPRWFLSTKIIAAGPSAEEAAQLRRDLHNLTVRRDRAAGCRRRLLAEMERSIAKRDVIGVKAGLSRC